MIPTVRRVAIIAIPVMAVACLLVYSEERHSSGLGSESQSQQFPELEASDTDVSIPPDNGTEVATFGSGCYWCTEAVFEQLKGVDKVISGFSGGHVPNPSYAEVCSGTTGHAEVVQVFFHPAVVSYAELLEVFWRTHDPTTKDRQGADRGPQYRSVIFYHNEKQKQLAERYRAKIDAAGIFSKPLVTTIEPFVEFFPADEGHQNYYANHRTQSYCRVVIGPKLEKLRALFAGKLKDE